MAVKQVYLCSCSKVFEMSDQQGVADHLNTSGQETHQFKELYINTTNDNLHAFGKTVFSLSASQIILVSTRNKTKINTVKWILKIKFGSLFSSREVLFNHNGSAVAHSEFAILGDPVNITISTALTATDLEISIQNNESGTIEVTLFEVSF